MQTHNALVLLYIMAEHRSHITQTCSRNRDISMAHAYLKHTDITETEIGVIMSWSFCHMNHINIDPVII